MFDQLFQPSIFVTSGPAARGDFVTLNTFEQSVMKSDIHRTMKHLRVTDLASYTNFCRALLPHQGDVCENIRGHFGSESSQ